MAEAELSTRRKRRGVVRASATRLKGKVRELESKTDHPDTPSHARRILQRMETLNSEFKEHHYGVIELLESEEDLSREQTVLDEFDDDVAHMSVVVERLLSSCSVTTTHEGKRLASRKLDRLKRRLEAVTEAIAATDVDVYLLRQHEADLSDYKKELYHVNQELLALDLNEEDELSVSHTNLEKLVFDASLNIRKILDAPSDREAPPTESKGVKLPKLDVPKFDGDILNWKTFWEQFNVSIHSQKSLSDAEKLIYLRSSVNEGSAKHAIEGLSRTGECYEEAIECLKMRYDRPRLIHQAHVKKIIEAQCLRDGSGKELRRLHDMVQQHLKALKAMDYEPSGPFITSVLELKLDSNTMFEWQRYSQEKIEIPHYRELLEFLNLRAQASESSVSDHPRPKTQKLELSAHPSKRGNPTHRSVTSYTVSAIESSRTNCVICKDERHPLYVCSKFRALSHSGKMSVLKANDLCINCLRSGHFVRECKSVHKCRICQKPHHSLLHTESKTVAANSDNSHSPAVDPVTSHTVSRTGKGVLLMTCRVLVESPDGLSVEARGLLDSASSSSFMSERLAQSLRLRRSPSNVKISGITGLSPTITTQSTATFTVSPLNSPHQRMNVSAIIVPRVTCDLPVSPIVFGSEWNHLSDIELADPKFGIPGKIDILFGVDVFSNVLKQGRRVGPPSAPMAIETDFGWVLAGNTSTDTLSDEVISHHVCTSLLSGDDILRKFWELEENISTTTDGLTTEEKYVSKHYRDNHYRTNSGQFVVPLPKRQQCEPLGESRSKAVRRFLNLERVLLNRSEAQEFHSVVQEYFDLNHAEKVPPNELEKPPEQVFYLPMHAVRKECSTTTKLRVVFDASAKTSTGVSLNDLFLVGPTVHSTLIDVLLRFRSHRIALTTDVSKMYRAIKLADTDKDLHQFVWRRSPDKPLVDYRITRVTFGVAASSFAANMSVKQNAHDYAAEYPLAAQAVEKSFYVDDGLTGADSIEEAIELHNQLQKLFEKGGFLLHKWCSSDQVVLEHIPPDLRDGPLSHSILESAKYTKTLGIQWNSTMDHFKLSVAELPPLENVTKRLLVSDVAKTFDILGWFSPSIIKVKILLQRLWQQRIDWDDRVPQPILDTWLRWRSELELLSTKPIQRCYFPKDFPVTSVELHGFSDASEAAYAAVVYTRVTVSNDNVHISLVMAKTKVAPIKRLTIPRLELCGALILARLLHHTRTILDVPLERVYAWTDSTIVLSWLIGNPNRFKTYVANRVSEITESIPPKCWGHVSSAENPADCGSRGLLPSELLTHHLWWNGPEWLSKQCVDWPQAELPVHVGNEEEKEVSLITSLQTAEPLFPPDRYSSFPKIKMVSAWIFRFLNNCCPREITGGGSRLHLRHLTVEELSHAENYWWKVLQSEDFPTEMEALKSGRRLGHSSCLFSLNPFLDDCGIMRVSGRQNSSKKPYSSIYPVIIHGRHSLAKLVIRSEHIRLLHAGPTLVHASLSLRIHVVGGRKIIRSIIRQCVVCRKHSARLQSQVMGNLPIERITPDRPFANVGVDYAGPFYVKYGYVRRPTVVKAYVSVFVSLTVKAVHLEVVSDLTSEAFIACLRRFVARRGKLETIMSDNGTNFVGSNREIKELYRFLGQQKTQTTIGMFCSSQGITWKFIPERALHFGGLWEAAVRSIKKHLRRVINDQKLTFEELSTVLAQVEACLNSRPLTPIPGSEETLEVLTPGHFLIGRPLEALPDHPTTCRPISLLKRWQLVQAITRDFWRRWSTEYLTSLGKIHKWHHPSRNIQVNDIVLLKDDEFVPTTKWLLARVIEVYPGSDSRVRVVTLKTSNGIYKRPIHKLVLLLPTEEN